MNRTGRKNPYIAACMFEILFFEDKRERKTIRNHGGAIFRRRAHSPCLLAKTTTTKDSIATTTNTINAKFLKHSPLPFVLGRSPFDFSGEKLFLGRSDALLSY